MDSLGMGGFTARVRTSTNHREPAAIAPGQKRFEVVEGPVRSRIGPRRQTARPTRRGLPRRLRAIEPIPAGS